MQLIKIKYNRISRNIQLKMKYNYIEWLISMKFQATLFSYLATLLLIFIYKPV